MRTAAYLSAPVKLENHRLKGAMSVLNSMGFDASCWDRSSVYTSQKLDESQVLIIYNDSWSWDLPSGVKREVFKAKNQGKPVFMLYQRKTDGMWGLYRIHYVGNAIKGMEGSCVYDEEEVAKTYIIPEVKKSLVVIDSVGSISSEPVADRRLLLMLK